MVLYKRQGSATVCIPIPRPWNRKRRADLLALGTWHAVIELPRCCLDSTSLLCLGRLLLQTSCSAENTLLQMPVPKLKPLDQKSGVRSFQDDIRDGFIYRLPPLPPTSKNRWFDDLMDFYWKWGVWIGNGGVGASQFGLRFGAALHGAFFSRKNTTFLKKHDFLWFPNDLSSKWT